MRLVWNKINSREKTRLCEIVDKYAATLGLVSLDSVLVKSTKFEKDGRLVGQTGIFRSTMIAPNKQMLKGTNLPELVEEIRSIINV